MPEIQAGIRWPQGEESGCGTGKAPLEGAVQEAFRRAEDAFCEYLLQAGLDDAAVDAAVEEWLGRGGAAIPGDLTELRRQNRQLEERLALSQRGIPPELAEKYQRLAGSYREEGADFADALDAALRDFPAAGSTDPSVAVRPAEAAVPSFAAPVRPGRVGAALTREQIDSMTPQELAERWADVEEYLLRVSGEKENRVYGY